MEGREEAEASPQSPSPAGGNRLRLRDAVILLALFVITLLAISRGARQGGSILFNLGPNDASYISGFAPSYEITDSVLATRWTTYDASIELPLIIEGGPVELSYRFWRVFPETAVVEVYLAQRLVDRFTCRGGQERLRRVSLAAVSETPVSIRFRVDSHERQNLGLNLDWVGLDVGPQGKIKPRGRARYLPALLASFLFLVFRWVRFSETAATLLVLPWILAYVIWAQLDPFGSAHVVNHLAIATMLLTTVAAAFLRPRPAGRWVVPIFVTGLLLKGVGLFYPTTFYPDVANARRYVENYPSTSGSMAERGVETQTKTGVGYPRNVGGKDYAFPYSPLYFWPFTLLSTPGAVEDAVRQVGLASAALEALAVFWLATTLFGPRAGVAASLLSVLLPPLYSRLILAMHAPLLGHLLDCWVMVAVLSLLLRPESKGRLAAVAGTTLASFLIYTSSLFSMSALLMFTSVLNRRLATRLLGVLVGAGIVTVGWLYWPFARAFFTEMLPALVDSRNHLGGPAAPAAGGGLLVALSRIPLFYGFAYPALALVGLGLARRRTGREGFRFLAAYGLAFLLLVGLRAFGAGLFKDLKEITFIAPWIAILAGLSLEEIGRRGRVGLSAALIVTLGLVAFGLMKYNDFLKTYASPVMVVVTTGEP